MSFVLEIGFDSHQRYIEGYLDSFFEAHRLKANVSRIGGKIVVEADADDPKLASVLHTLRAEMPYSCFMTSERHRLSESPFRLSERVPAAPLPLSLGLCSRCREEMTDPASRRYYYPFTSCRHCGAQYAFFEGYPYDRSHTSWRSVPPCPECEREAGKNPFRRDYAQISCHRCTLPLKMTHRGESRCVSGAAGCKALFERAAEAISRGERVVMKTTFGYRKFAPIAAEHITSATRLLHINSRTLTEDLSPTPREIEALYSLEKPLLKVAVQCASLRALFGPAVLCKVPDEGFTFLLGRELEHLHIDHLLYEECDEAAEGEFRVTFDLPTTAQRDLQLFVGPDVRFVAEGERVSFPAEVASASETLCVTERLVALKCGSGHLVDRAEHFGELPAAARVNLMEGCAATFEGAEIRTFSAAEGALKGALVSRGVESSAVGLYFEGDALTFLHSDGGGVATLLSAVPFEPARLHERLGEALQPELEAVVKRIEAEGAGLFDALARIIGLEGGGFDALDNAALTVAGRDGKRADLQPRERRFDPYECMERLIGYRMGGVPKEMLACSLFLSLGEYCADTLIRLQEEMQAERLVLCGAQSAQTTFYGRIAAKTRGRRPLLNRSFPVGGTGAVVGGIFL